MTAKTGKQSTLQFKPVATKPKKSPCSEDEADQSGSEEEEEEVIAPRERVGRRAKGEAAWKPWANHCFCYMCEGCSRWKTMLILSCRCCQVQHVWQRGGIEFGWEEECSQTEGCYQWRRQFPPRARRRGRQRRRLSSTISQSSRACVSMTKMSYKALSVFSFAQYKLLCRKKVTKSKSTVKPTESKSTCKSWSCDDLNQS